jgi:hypothetical protein
MENEEVREILIDLIQGDDNLENPNHECSLATILAVEHLGQFNDERSNSFLLSQQNHQNPAFQTAIQKELDNK